MTKEIIFSFSGGMFPYYLGIASVLENYDLSDVIFSGTSGGCFPALLLNSHRNSNETFEKILKYIEGNDKQWVDVIKGFLEQELDEKDVSRNNGKLYIKLTKLNDYFIPEKVIVKKWTDKNDLAKCISVACFVPYITGSGLSTTYRGHNIVDGFFSNTSTIPVTKNSNMTFKLNKWRSFDISSIIPTSDTKKLRNMFEDGVNDTKKHIHEIDNFLNPVKEIVNKNGDNFQKT